MISKCSLEFRFLTYWLVLTLLVTLAMSALLYWDIDLEQEETIHRATIEARTAFRKDYQYRRWAAIHGGVYAPVTQVTPPNPNLSHIKERDITTPSGVKLTLINPAYMTRQVNELMNAPEDVVAHITSLRPIRELNAPDEWEITALEKLKNTNEKRSY